MVRVGAFAVIAAVGFGLGRWLRADEVEGQASPALASPAAAWSSLELRGDPCDHVAMVDALLASTHDEIEGVAAPFPADDPSVLPEAFQQRLNAAQQACPDMTVDHVDCDEYPCVAWVRDPCPAASDELRSDGAWIRNVTLGDGRPAHWQTLELRSADDEGVSAFDRAVASSNVARRAETRLRRAKVAIQEVTGAREMTDVEIATELERARGSGP